MATKRLLIEVEEGHTECMKCPFKVTSKICSNVKCAKFNLATMKIKEYDDTNEGKALLYAVEKTAERTKREMIEKAVKWIRTNWREYINGPDKDGCIAFAHWENDFRRAMEEEV